jgi:hypothetical protein
MGDAKNNGLLATPVDGEGLVGSFSKRKGGAQIIGCFYDALKMEA